MIGGSQFLKRVAHQISQIGHDLLSPAKHHCALCGGLYPIVKNPLNLLCPACQSKIPWVQKVRCAVCGRYEHCNDCGRRTDTFFIRNRSAVEYNAVMKEWLARYKYRGDERLAAVFSEMMGRAYRMHVKEADLADKGFDYVTFVPLSEERLLERGFNQAGQLAGGVGSMFNVSVIPLLARVRHTDKQSYKKRSARLDDLQDAFSIDPAALETIQRSSGNRPLNVLVVDDVYTTGSTLNQCAKIITRHLDANVYGITWAR